MAITKSSLTIVRDRETLPSVRDCCQESWPTLRAVFQNVIQAPGGSKETKGSPSRAGRQTRPNLRQKWRDPAGTQKTVGPDVGSADPTCTLEGVLTMLDHTTNPNLRKTPRDLLLRVLNAIGSKIFQTGDCRVRGQGWQVIPRHGGLSRTYRDPRFDYLIPCQACNGRGYTTDGTSCFACDGSGRLVLDGADTTQPRRGQQEWGRL